MSQLVFFLEEPSAKALLQSLLPRILPATIHFRCIAFEGKQDLEKQLLRKLRAWQQPDCHFIVVRDKDSADCVDVKNRLRIICENAGKPETLIRIACHELESWYLGDLLAVEQGLNINGLAEKQGQTKYRNPDRLVNPKQELRKLTGNVYQQIAGSRDIAPYLNLKNNCSTSFNFFLTGIQQLIMDIQQ